MTSVSRKIHSRRRLAALTFLSNISLDGTHRDTNLGQLNFSFQNNRSKITQSLPLDRRDSLNTSSKSTGIRSKIQENSYIIKSVDIEEEKLNRRDGEDKISEKHYRFDDQLQSKNKDKVHKFVSDAKARLCNLSQKRKQFTHQKSVDSYGLPDGKSTESLAISGCRSRKPSLCPSECSVPTTAEIKYIKTLSECKTEANRIILISEKKVPVVLFSILPYSRTQLSFKGELKLDGSRRRHTSSRQLTIINDGPDPLDLLAFLGVEKPQEGQDISYGELLAPSHGLKKLKHFETWPELENSFRFPYHIHSSGYSIEHVSRVHSKLSSTPPKSFDKIGLEKEDNSGYGFPWLSVSAVYHPNLLDDPELIAGKHNRVLGFPSYKVM